MPSSSNRQSNNLSRCPKELDQHTVPQPFAGLLLVDAYKRRRLSPLTGQLHARAVSPQYDQIVKDASRETVQAFVSTWLLSQRRWGKEPEYRIVVLFPGEPTAARGDKSESLQ